MLLAEVFGCGQNGRPLAERQNWWQNRQSFFFVIFSFKTTALCWAAFVKPVCQDFLDVF